MSPRTVNWAASRTRRNGEPEVEGLRERKKRLMRQQLSDTATEMFVERGFDAVRVAEIAEACGVSEKTVFNYFPTKESLILDHPDAALTALRSDLAEPGVSPVEATLRILAEERAAVLSWLAEQDDPAEAVTKSRRFGLLIATTPALRAHRLEMTEQLVVVAAEALAERAGDHPGRPGTAGAGHRARRALADPVPVDGQAPRRHPHGGGGRGPGFGRRRARGGTRRSRARGPPGVRGRGLSYFVVERRRATWCATAVATPTAVKTPVATGLRNFDRLGASLGPSSQNASDPA